MKKSLLSLLVCLIFVPGLASATITELIGNPAADPVETIPVKDTGDAFSATEFNTIIDLLRGMSRDDNGTLADQTDDKVGIGGILLPDEALEVNGRVKATFFLGDGSLLTGIDAGYWVQNGSAVNYPTGNVGIGVAGPSEELQINSTRPVVRLVDTDDSSYTDMVYNSTTSSIQVDPNDSVASSKFVVYTDGSEKIRVSDVGDFSVGESSSGGYKLSVNDDDATGAGLRVTGGGGGQPIAVFTRDVGGTGSIVMSGSGSDPQMYFNQGGNLFSMGVDGGKFKVAGSSTIGTTDRLTIDSSGNVGIGTASPAGTRLQVDSGTTDLVGRFMSTDNRAGIEISDDDTTTYISTENNVASIGPNLGVNTGNLNIDSSGNVGVKDVSPSYDLDVTGDINFTGDLYQNGSAYGGGGKFIDGTPTATEAVYTGGNVGVGIADPSRQLHVYATGGAPSLSSSSGESAFFGNPTTQGMAIGAASSSPYGMWLQVKRPGNDGTSYPLLLNPVGGKVGVGIVAPTYQLDVNDDAATGAGLRVTGGGTGGPLAVFQRDVGSTGSIVMNANSGNPQMYFNNSVGGNIFALGVDGTSFKISDNSTIGTNDRLTIQNSGYVGIGTTIPSGLLEVSGVTAGVPGELFVSGSAPGYVDAAVVLQANNNTNYRGLGVFMHDAGGDTEWYAGTPYADSNSYIIARSGSLPNHDRAVAQNGNALMSIRSDGKVGIGTTAPSATLHVNHTGASNQMALFEGAGNMYNTVSTTTTGYARTWYKRDGAWIGSVGADASGDITMSYGGGLNDDIVINSSGNVGIGDGSPTEAKLSVTGNADVSQHMAVGANASVLGNVALNVDEHFSTDENTYQLYSSTTTTSPAITTSRTTYGAYFDSVNNKTESGAYHSLGIGLYGRSRTNGSNNFNYNTGVMAEGSTTSTGANQDGLRGVYAVAQNNSASATIPYAHGGQLRALGRSVANTGTISNAYGVEGSVVPYHTDITSARGGYFVAQTGGGSYDGSITTAYGVDARVPHTSTVATMGTAYGVYSYVYNGASSSNITTATGVYSNVDGATTAYGAQIYANDSDATSNYGIYVDASNASGNNAAIYVANGDIIFPSGIDIRTNSGEMRCPANQMMVGFDTGGIMCEAVPQTYQ